MSRFVSPNLARLPALPLPSRDFEAIYQARVGELAARLAAKGITFDTGSVDGDPLSAVEQAGAYRELLVLSARDDAIRALLLATSWGTYLDHLGATQIPPVVRLPIAVSPRSYESNPEDWELDDDFRARIQLGPEALTTCGSEGAYLWFALATPGVKAAQVYGPMSFGGVPGLPFAPLGEVHIPIVSTRVDGEATADLCAAVMAAVSPDERRPIADFVTVLPAEIIHYSIDVVLIVGPGADAEALREEAEKRLGVLAARQHRPAGAVLHQNIYAAAGIADAFGAPLVDRVTINLPLGDVNADLIAPASAAAAYRAPYCDAIKVAVEVDDG